MNQFSLRVVIADDHPAILIGIRQILERIEGIQLTGSARNSGELIALLASQPCDVLISDYSMPGGEYGDGVVLLEFIRRHYPAIQIVVMTMLDSPALLAPLMQLGVRCIVSKADDASHLVPAIHVAHGGGSYVSPSLATIAERLEQSERKPQLHQLTARELEVSRLFSDGLSVNEIAAVLNRSKQTISAQKASAMKKLGLERDADLIKYALRTGLLSQ